MLNQSHARLTDSSVRGDKFVPDTAKRADFSRRLYSLMLERGWTQSELARRAGLNRDVVSTYCRGRAYPTLLKLHSLAKALNVDPEQLAPGFTEMAGEPENTRPPFEMKMIGNVAYIQVNKRVSAGTAVEIAKLIEADDVDDGAGSGDAPTVQPRKS